MSTAAGRRLAPSPVASRRLTPSAVASLTLWAVVIVNLVIVEVLYFTVPGTPGPLQPVGRFLGVHAALLMALQVILVARVPWLDRRLGMGQLTSWHRWIGFALMWTVVVHATLGTIVYMRLRDWPFTTLVEKFTGSLGTLAGIIAGTVLVVIGATSVRFARRRLPYEAWHTVHLLTWLAFALVIVHQTIEGGFAMPSTAAKIYWPALWTFAAAAFVLGRIVLPLWRNARHGLRVSAVVPESDNVVSVHVTGRNLDRMPALAGQFFLWRFLTPGRWWQVNPFSLSAAPDGRTLRLTAKAVGSGSAGLRDLRIGTRVFAEGPYGAFTSLHRTKPATLLVAGGVGITPVRSLLEELDGSVVVVYRVRTPADAVLLDELRELAAARQAELHVVMGRTKDTAPPPLSAEHLLALVPDVAQRDVFVCGPPAMTDAVLDNLRALGVPRAQLHAEIFALAT
jgi:predicted ferric reductase